MDFELYCDSSAALGITQRAGIGKVRHLRTQALWVQETRASGRISYQKVLGTKNPADLLTKSMSAELAKQHLKTLNVRMESGRAESAPTLDLVEPESHVVGWYEDLQGSDEGHEKPGFEGVDGRSARRERPLRSVSDLFCIGRAEGPIDPAIGFANGGSAVFCVGSCVDTRRRDQLFSRTATGCHRSMTSQYSC